jgi:hypothetical protein
VLVLVAIAAIALKAWWRDDRANRKNDEVQTRLREFESTQSDLTRSIDSLRTVTRATLDSVRTAIESSDAPQPPGDSGTSEAATLSRAQAAWNEALRALPKDLTAYERKVATQELKESVRTRYELSKEQIDFIAKPR